MSAHPNGLNYFFPGCQMRLASTSSLVMANFIRATSFVCENSTWVFMGVIALSFAILDKAFVLNHWYKSKTPICFVFQIMHHNICGFSTSIGKLSWTTKKTLAYWSLIMWLPSRNLGLYSYKLLYFNFNKI